MTDDTRAEPVRPDVLGHAKDELERMRRLHEEATVNNATLRAQLEADS